MNDITVNKFDELSLRLTASRSIENELKDYFSFFAEGYKHQPMYRKGLWDGKIRLYNCRNHLLPIGLLTDLARFCKSREYTISVSKDLRLINVDNMIESFDFDQLSATPRDYQLDAYQKSLRMNRSLVLSPTRFW